MRIPILQSNNDFFGLEISDRSLKIAQSKKKGDRFVLTWLHEIKIPKNIVENYEVKDEKALSQLLFESIHRKNNGRVKGRKVVCSLPEEKSFVDVLFLPFTESKKELEQMALNEAENRIPYPLSEVHFDFEVIGKEKNLLEIAIAACPKKIVESYSNVIKLAGFFPIAMEVESLALSRALFQQGKIEQETCLVVDFGSQKTNFIIFTKENVRFTSTIQCSSDALTENISKAMNVSLKAADCVKIKQGLLGKQKAVEAMMPSLRFLVEQIKTYLAYYQTHQSEQGNPLKIEKTAQKVILCGGGANLKGIVDFLNKELALPVAIADPLANFDKKQVANVLTVSKREALIFATALGLSIRKNGD